MAHSLESLGGIHKKNGKLLETSLLKKCEKNIGGACTKQVATGKHRFAANKEA